MTAATHPTRLICADRHVIRAGMVGMGMIFDETYRPFFEGVHAQPLFDPAFGICEVQLTAVASRTGRRAEAYRKSAAGRSGDFASYTEPDSIGQMLAASNAECGMRNAELNRGQIPNSALDFVCVATPDDRHFEAAKAVLQAGKHLLVEKPSVLTLQELDELDRLAREHRVLAKVVYHKLLDPDHKKLRTLVVDSELRHVNNGYCSLLEPKLISGAQFSEWITGRNPGTYVAVHYIKLIDFTFGGRLKTVMCTGQRGLVGPADGPTWDSTQLRMIYEYGEPASGVASAPRAREAAFDIHTSWVTPNNFPGYVEQEVQFRFDNGVWNAHSRKRGVELTIEGRTPLERKININNHYNGTFAEPWGARSQRGYGIEVLERFAREVATVEFGGPPGERDQRLSAARALSYNDISADRQTVAAVQAMEAILALHAAGEPDCVVRIDESGALELLTPGNRTHLLYGK